MSFYDELTNTQKLYSMYFIAKYESSWCWDGHNYTANVNYGDPFTVGIMQWAGTSAYHFLNNMRSYDSDLYDTMPGTWKDAVDIGTGSRLWGGYSMDYDDVEHWRASVSDNLDDMKAYSQYYWCESQWVESLYSELQVLDNHLPFPANPTLDQVKAVYFYLARYHNTASNIYRIMDVYGYDGDLADIRDATISMYRSYTNFGIYGAGWINAINDNYDELVAWDGSSVPDFGQIEGYGYNEGSQNNNTAVQDVSSWDLKVNYIKIYGESLVLVDSKGNNHIFYRSNANNIWLPRSRTIESGDNSSSSQSGSMTPSDIIDQVMQYYVGHENAYGYSLADPSIYDHPDISGATNCSAWIRYVAKQLSPNSEMANMSSSYTGVMAVTGTEIASGTQNTPFPYGLAEPGDILLVNWTYYDPEYAHVELYLGTDAQGNTTGSELWGAGSPPCPHKNGYASSYVTGTHDWQLRRISWEE